MDRPPSGHASIGAALRAVVYLCIFYVLMPVWGLVFLPAAIVSRRATVWVMKTFTRIAFWLLWIICGTRCERRGQVPQGPCIVASKHQSFLDVMMLMLWLPEPRYVMKRSIMWAPVLGIYAMRLGSIPIDRGSRGVAMRSIITGVKEARDPGQVIIFPQGTRVPVGEDRPYKSGVARLAKETGYQVQLVAVNTGWFWPKSGLRRSPGTAVLEFIGPLPEGISPDRTLAEIEDRIEAASAQLAKEAAASFDPRCSAQGLSQDR